MYKENSVVKDVLSWFEYGIENLNYGLPMQELRMVVSTSENVKQLMFEMIREMDLGIVDFRVEEKENEKIDILKKHYINNMK